MEDVVQEALIKGFEFHKSGQFDLAKKLYASVIEVEPRHPDANHNIGVIEMDLGRVLEAIPLLRIALEENPDNSQYWVSYIDALVRLGALEDARNMLDQARQKGAQGEPFDLLEQRLKELNDKASDDSFDEMTQNIAESQEAPADIVSNFNANF
jgi:tetratricopeptide (TPR) repeat protein